MAASRKRSLFNWFPALLACEIGTLVLCRGAVIGASASEARFNSLSPAVFNTGVLVWIFISNALVFVPLGQRMGVLFNAMPRLSAYAWDLAGSLCGTLFFGVFSLRFFSPLAGMAIVMIVYLAMSGPTRWRLNLPVFLAAGHDVRHGRALGHMVALLLHHDEPDRDSQHRGGGSAARLADDV